MARESIATSLTDLQSPVVLRPSVGLDLAGNQQLGSGCSDCLCSSNELLFLSLALNHRVGSFTEVASG